MRKIKIISTFELFKIENVEPVELTLNNMTDFFLKFQCFTLQDKLELLEDFGNGYMIDEDIKITIVDYDLHKKKFDNKKAEIKRQLDIVKKDREKQGY